MLLQSALVALLTCRGLLASPLLTGRSDASVQSPARSLTEDQAVSALINSPHLMPPQMLAQVSKLRRRSAQGSFLGISGETLSALPNIILSLPSVIGSLSTAPLKPDAPASTQDELQNLGPSDLGWANVKRVKVRYGPFRVPAKQERNLDWLVWNMEGEVTSVKYNVKRPCEGDCSILRVVSDLELADGAPATVEKDGVLYHHSILFNTGNAVREATCNQPFVENIFMSGNERGMTNYTVPHASIASAYRVHPEDALLLVTELQNFSDRDKYVWQTVTYDVWPGAQERAVTEVSPFREAHIVWLTIGRLENPSVGICNLFRSTAAFGESNLTDYDLPRRVRFSEHSWVWTAQRDGHILATGGHMHPGATDVDIYRNGERICRSVPTYERGGAGEHMHGKRQVAGGNYTNLEVEQIRRISMCEFPHGIQSHVGDRMHIVANYDFGQHKGTLNPDGNLDAVMGMSGLLIAFN